MGIKIAKMRGPANVLNHSSSTYEINDQDNDGDNQQNMQYTAERVAADQSKEPENEQDDDDCPQHLLNPRDEAGFGSEVVEFGVNKVPKKLKVLRIVPSWRIYNRCDVEATGQIQRHST
jgi:hypothetical protein